MNTDNINEFFTTARLSSFLPKGDKLKEKNIMSIEHPGARTGEPSLGQNFAMKADLLAGSHEKFLADSIFPSPYSGGAKEIWSVVAMAQRATPQILLGGERVVTCPDGRVVGFARNADEYRQIYLENCIESK